MQDYMIETRGLTRPFGKILAVDDLNLRAPEACVYGFLGPNGAGETTAIRLLLGLCRPDAGEVHMFGTPLANNRLSLMRRVGALVESPSLYPHLTGRENLEVTRRILAAPRALIDWKHILALPVRRHTVFLSKFKRLQRGCGGHIVLALTKVFDRILKETL